MKMKHSLYIYIATALLTLASCGGEKKEAPSQTTAPTPAAQPAEVALPQFSADSALAYIKRQCDFGPRVTGSKESQRCGDYLVGAFRTYGAMVEEQQCEVVRYDGERLSARNIIARVNPGCTDRIMFCSHWDSRPWADYDPDPAMHHTPILGANDGASGVGVMLELCRLLQEQPARVGVDFICFDAEDMGTPQWDEKPEDNSDTWCLGSRAWAVQAVNEGYTVRYGILLDMVGGRGATFSLEGFSLNYASHVIRMVWAQAQAAGYGSFFPMTAGGYITDDHLNVNTIARIPCIDIVPYYPDNEHSSFGPTWHTMQDTPENIDRYVLNAVGNTLARVIYSE